MEALLQQQPSAPLVTVEEIIPRGALNMSISQLPLLRNCC